MDNDKKFSVDIKSLIVCTVAVILITVGIIIAYEYEPESFKVNSQVPTTEDLVKDRLGPARAAYTVIAPNFRDEFMRQIDLCANDDALSYEGSAVTLYNAVPSLVSFDSMDLVASEDITNLTLEFTGTTSVPKEEPIFASAYIKLYTIDGSAIWSDMLSVRHGEVEGEAVATFIFPAALLNNLSEETLNGMVFTLSVDFYPQVSSESSITIDGALTGLKTGGIKWLSLKIIDAEHYGAPISDAIDGFVGFGGGGAESVVADISCYSEQTEYTAVAQLANHPSFVTVAHIQLYSDETFSSNTVLYSGGLPVEAGNGVDFTESPLGISTTKDEELNQRLAHWNYKVEEFWENYAQTTSQQLGE